MSVIVSFGLAIALAAVLTPVAKLVAIRVGAMDYPNALSIHSVPTPRLGGAAIYLATTGALLAGAYLYQGLKPQEWQWLAGIVMGATIIFATGVVEDIRRLPSVPRLMLHIAAGVVTIAWSVQWGFIPVLVVSYLVTLLYLIGGANSLNLLDGMNGLATGFTLIASLSLVGLSLLTAHGVAAIVGASLGGACLGFLFYNFPKGSIFLGDSGSLYLGFVLASLVVLLTNKPYGVTGMISATIVMLLPIIDTGLAILRRLRTPAALFSGDRWHTYDLLHSIGISPTKVVMTMYALAIVTGASGLLVSQLPTLPALAIALTEAMILTLVFLKLQLSISKART